MGLVQKEVKKVYMYKNGQDVQVRPTEQKREPGPNTVLYIPFDETYGATDQSGNSYTVTSGFTLGTYNNVYCARNTNVNNIIETGIRYNTQYQGNSIFTNPYTVNVRMYIESKPSGNYISGISGFRSGSTSPQHNIGMETFTANAGVVRNKNTSYGFDYGNWVNVVCTVVPASSGYDYSLYLNGVFQKTQNDTSTNMPGSTHYINYIMVGTTSWATAVGTCYSQYILENKARTAQEVADYYNSTKSNYGL